MVDPNDPELFKESTSIEVHNAKDPEKPQFNSTEVGSTPLIIDNYLQRLPADLWLELAKYNVADYGYVLNPSIPLQEARRTNRADLERFAGLTDRYSTQDHNPAGFTATPNLSDVENESYSSPNLAGTPPNPRFVTPPLLPPDSHHRAKAYEETPPDSPPTLHLSQRLVPPQLFPPDSHHRAKAYEETPPDSPPTLHLSQRLVPPQLFPPDSHHRAKAQDEAPTELSCTPQNPRLVTPPYVDGGDQHQMRIPAASATSSHMSHMLRPLTEYVIRALIQTTPPDQLRSYTSTLPPLLRSYMFSLANTAQDSAPVRTGSLSRSLSLPNLMMDHQHPAARSADSSDHQLDIEAATENLSPDLLPVPKLRSIDRTVSWRQKMINMYGIKSKELKTLPSPIARSSSLTHIAINTNENAYKDIRPATPDFNRAAASIKQVLLQRRLIQPVYLMEQMVALSYQLMNASPEFQLELCKKSIRSFCITLEHLLKKYLEDLKNPNNNATNLLGYYIKFINHLHGKILNLQINTRNGVRLAFEVAASSKNSDFFQFLSSSLKELLLIPYANLPGVYKKKQYLVAVCYKMFKYPEALFKYIGKAGCDEVIAWMISNAIDIDIHALIQGAGLIGDLNRLQTICQKLTQYINETMTIGDAQHRDGNTSQSILYRSYPNNSQNVHADNNRPNLFDDVMTEQSVTRLFHELFHGRPPAYEQFNRYRKIIIGLCLYLPQQVMPDNHDDSKSTPLVQYELKAQLQVEQCRKAINFIFSLVSPVYSFEHRLKDILYELTRAFIGETRVKLLHYAIECYQNLQVQKPILQRPPSLNILSTGFLHLLIVNSIRDNPSIEDAGILKYFSTLFNAYFSDFHANEDRFDLKDAIVEILDIVRECQTGVSDIFLTSPQLWAWFESRINHNLTRVQDVPLHQVDSAARKYFLNLCMRGAFDLVSSFLDLQRKVQKIYVREQDVFEAIAIAINHGYKITCRLLLEECHFRNYPAKHKDYIISILFDSIEYGQTEYTDLLSEFGAKSGICNDLKALIFLADSQNKYVAFMYYLKKCRDELENLSPAGAWQSSSFRTRYPTERDALFKLHSYLMIKPSVLNFLLYQDVFVAELWANVFNSMLTTNHRSFYSEQRPDLWRLYLRELLTGGFTVCKSQLDLFILACVKGDASNSDEFDEDKHFTAILTEITKIGSDKYPDYLRMCKAKLEEIAKLREKTRILSEKTKKAKECQQQWREKMKEKYGIGNNESAPDITPSSTERWREKMRKRYGVSNSALKPPVAGGDTSEERSDYTPGSLPGRTSPAQLLGNFSAVLPAVTPDREGSAAVLPGIDFKENDDIEDDTEQHSRIPLSKNR